MWNLTNRTRATSPPRWDGHHLNDYKEMSESLIVMPDRLPDVEIYRARTVIPAVQTGAPKHPKKRFLEAATAQLQLEEHTPAKRAPEDNSALMQLAEMCIYYQKANHPPRTWSPTVGWNQVERSFEPPVYSISMSTTVKQTNASPKAATPFCWSGWSGGECRPTFGSPTAVDENEEPLDLSGEETFRTNQQELIDCLVEKLCARPVSVKYSSLVQQKLSLLEPSPRPVKQEPVSDISSLLNSSSEVSSSSVIDHKDVHACEEAKGNDVRRDLPLKKRDSLCLFNPPDICSTSSESSTSSSSSLLNSDSTVSSTNTQQSKKPAPRSCKGKRYLEFMYEGRISSLASARVRRRSESNEAPEAVPFGRKRQRRHLTETGKPTLTLRGRPKLRKIS